MLVRKYIGERMVEYYSQSANAVVGGLPAGGDSVFKLSALLWGGEWRWKRAYKKLFDQQRGQWLTPVELFQPYYSNTVANFVASTTAKTTGEDEPNESEDIDIVELGGGRGTNARLVLDHLRSKHRAVYERVKTYTVIDASPTLHELQKQRLVPPDSGRDQNNSDDGGNSGSGSDTKFHLDKIRLVQKDLLDVAEKREEFLSPSSRRTFLIALEVLDNLPHDKIHVQPIGRYIDQAEIQHHIHPTNTNKSLETAEEVFIPLHDPLIKLVVQTAPTYSRMMASAPRSAPPVTTAWIPTVACAVLRQLFTDRPNSNVLLADFDWLPPPDLERDAGHSDEAEVGRKLGRLSTWAMGEPIVTSMDGMDHECYLRAPKFCDILFPTNFGKLASFLERSRERRKTRSKSSPSPPSGKRVPQRRGPAGASTASATRTTPGPRSSAKASYRPLPFDCQIAVQKQADFLELYGPEQVRATKSWLTGFTPLLHDFANCSVLTVVTKLPSAANAEGFHPV